MQSEQQPDGPVEQWEPIHSLLPHDLIDGKRIDGLLMRKWSDGKYVYRSMTPDEELVYAENHAW